MVKLKRKLYGVRITYPNGMVFGYVDHTFDSYDKAEAYAIWAEGLPEQSNYLIYTPVELVEKGE